MDIHTIIVIICIFIFCFIGFFGNISFICAVATNGKLRTGRGLLLLSLCFMHSIMLLHNFINVFRIIEGIRLTKEECVFAQSIPPTMYAVSHQAMLYVVLGIDVLFSLFKPIRYSHLKVVPYVIIMQIPCIIYASSFIIASQYYDDNRSIAVCNPPEAFPIVVNEVRTKIGLCIGCMVLLLYILIIVVLCRKSSTGSIRNATIRAIKSIIALTFTYLLSWFCTVIISFFATQMPHDSFFIKMYHHYAVVFALISYSSTYYIHFVISPEYRRVFLTSFACKPFEGYINENKSLLLHGTS